MFGQNSSQEEVFAEVQPVVTSVMDGYNVCIFAYGQTGQTSRCDKASFAGSTIFYASHCWKALLQTVLDLVLLQLCLWLKRSVSRFSDSVPESWC